MEFEGIRYRVIFTLSPGAYRSNRLEISLSPVTSSPSSAVIMSPSSAAVPENALSLSILMMTKPCGAPYIICMALTSLP